jgi:hypothetical protein
VSTNPSDPTPPNPDPAPAPPTGGDAPRTFSQEELDRIVQDRVARVKSTPPADYEDLKAAAARLAELEAANQSELEKAQARAEAAEKRAATIETEARETRLRSAIIAEAAKPGRNVVDPDAAIALLDRSTLQIDDSGMPTNVAEAMDKLLEARPYLVASSGGATRGSADQGARRGAAAGQLSEDDLKGMTAEQIVEARRAGRLQELGVAP